MKSLTILTALLALLAVSFLAVGGDDPSPATTGPEKEREPCADCPGAGCPDCPARSCPGCEEGKACPECAAKAAKAEKPDPDLAPDFSGKNLARETVKLSDYAGKWVVLEWINHGCPFVKKHYAAGTMQALQKRYAEKGVVWITICSSAPGKQGHMSAEEWKRVQAEKGAAPTELILDPEGEIGRLYQAARTPHMVVIDPKRQLVYEGAIDDKPREFEPERVKAALCYVVAVLDAVLAGRESPHRKIPAYGCSVKYGN